VVATDGYGYGDGYGDVYGYGYGYGDGYGDGYGYGYGYGSGYGYGYGYGSGYGYGYGYGDDYGDGAGYGVTLTDVSPAESVVMGIWRSSASGTAANGGTDITPAAPGVVHEVKGPLSLCGPRALHATTDPKAYKGDRWWLVAMHEPVMRDGDKIGSLKRTIISELL
jgi:hypothetical protein